jgi:hypothetical protein
VIGLGLEPMTRDLQEFARADHREGLALEPLEQREISWPTSNSRRVTETTSERSASRDSWAGATAIEHEHRRERDPSSRTCDFQVAPEAVGAPACLPRAKRTLATVDTMHRRRAVEVGGLERQLAQQPDSAFNSADSMCSLRRRMQADLIPSDPLRSPLRRPDPPCSLSICGDPDDPL